MPANQHIVSGRASFILRFWWESGQGVPIWRGQVQHVLSGHQRYFQNLDELANFVELYVGPLAPPKTGVDIRDVDFKNKKGRQHDQANDCL